MGWVVGLNGLDDGPGNGGVSLVDHPDAIIPALLRPKPPNRNGNVAAILDDSGTFAGLSSNRLQKHDHI